MAASKVSLKLLIDKQNHKVLFAEARKDFVDFLISLLSLPVGTVTKLLTKQYMVGSLGNLYDCIENMSEIYMQPNQDKNSLLNPKVLAAGAPFFLLDNVSAVKSKKFYRCSKNYNHPNIADEPGAGCPDCGNSMSSEVRYVPRVVAKDKEAAVADDQEGYVKGVVTYMVTDDLVVQPMSTISCVTLLNKFNVKDLGALEERVVHLGMKEGLKMLKASLQSKKVFTSVFLEKPLQIKGLPNLPPK